MSQIGSQLRQAREARGLSIEDIQKATRIKRIYIEAIEAEQFQALPGPIQARGFVRSYASHLGIDADELLTQLGGNTPRSSTTAPLARTVASANHNRESAHAPRAARHNDPAPGAWPLPLPILIAGVVLLFVIGGLLILQALSAESPAPGPTPLANVNNAIRPQALEDAATELPSPIPREVVLTVSASEHVWVRITQDGVIAYEGFLIQDEATTWRGGEQVIIETGNAAALTIEVNGQPIGVMGARNNVAVRGWTPDGEVTVPLTVTAPQASNSEPEASPTPNE
jgi:cytoskeletal protein RodZ